MTVIGDICKSKGIKTKFIWTYGQPLQSGFAPFASLAAAVAFYNSRGFFGYVQQDGTNGIADLPQQYAAWKAAGGVVSAPMAGWGYTTQMYDLGRGGMATLYPNEQEYYLSLGALVVAMNFGIPGIVIDAPGLVTEWLWLYSQIDFKVGLKNLACTAGWLKSDHPVNNAGAQGKNGMHNMNSYTRYVNSSLGLYLNDVSLSGSHVADGTPCFLWKLRGASTNFQGKVTVTVDLSGYPVPGTGIIPTVALANDITNYHRKTQTYQNYAAAMNAQLELALLQAMQAKGQAFARTAMPAKILALVPNYMAQPLELMAPLALDTGGYDAVVPYFNYLNCQDNSSNAPGTDVPCPGSTTILAGYGIATPASVLNFFLGQVPYRSNLPFLEADTMVNLMQGDTQTAFAHFGALWSILPIDGWFGQEQDTVNVLSIDHNWNEWNTFSSLGLVCHPWGVDPTMLPSWNLNQFKVLFSPTGNFDVNQVTAAVQGGANLLLYGPPLRSPPVSLTGIGTTATQIPYPHPVLAPYLQADLDAVYSGTYGYINKVGSGTVVTLPQFYSGEGFNVPNAGQGGDGLASGLGYLSLNAIMWLGGLSTPGIYIPKFVKRTSWAAPLNASGQGSKSGVGIHLIQRSNPVLLLSNANAVAVPINFSLRSALYGYPGNYSLRDANTGMLLNGTGDVLANVTLPSQDWMVFSPQGGPTPTTLVLSAKVLP